MQTKSLKKNLESPANVGQLISTEQKDHLVENFKEYYPSKKQSFSISKQLLSYILTAPDVSGIRFMYGVKDTLNPETCIVLIPCNNDVLTVNGNLPNIIINSEGYFLHSGENVSFEQTWKLLFNHVITEHRLNPDQNLKTIHRGDFWGINMLMDFINNPKIESLVFNLGYSPIDGDFSKGIHPVLDALDSYGASLNISMDFTSPCPQICSGTDPDGDGACITTNMVYAIEQNNDETELEILRVFRKDLWLSENGHLVEMYYHTSPVLTAAIREYPDKEQIYKTLYNNYLTPCIEAIDDNNTEKALDLYHQAFGHLFKNYSK